RRFTMSRQSQLASTAVAILAAATNAQADVIEISINRSFSADAQAGPNRDGPWNSNWAQPGSYHHTLSAHAHWDNQSNGSPSHATDALGSATQSATISNGHYY